VFPRGNSQKGYDSDIFEKGGFSAESRLLLCWDLFRTTVDGRETAQRLEFNCFFHLSDAKKTGAGWREPSAVSGNCVASEQRGGAFSLLGVGGTCDPQAIWYQSDREPFDFRLCTTLYLPYTLLTT